MSEIMEYSDLLDKAAACEVCPIPLPPLRSPLDLPPLRSLRHFRRLSAAQLPQPRHPG